MVDDGGAVFAEVEFVLDVDRQDGWKKGESVSLVTYHLNGFF